MQAENNTKEILDLWEGFRKELEKHRSDHSYSESLRAMGFEVKHMAFVNNEILFTVLTSFPVIIPYTILAGGYPSCITYIANEIDNIRRLCLRVSE